MLSLARPNRFELLTPSFVGAATSVSQGWVLVNCRFAIPDERLRKREVIYGVLRNAGFALQVAAVNRKRKIAERNTGHLNHRANQISSVRTNEFLAQNDAYLMRAAIVD